MVLYYNCLKNNVDFKVDIDVKVAEFLGKDLRDALARKASKEEINSIYTAMERACATLFIQSNDFKMDIINKHNVSNDFKKLFIESFDTLDISKIKHHSKIFVKPNFLDMFFTYLFPRIKKKFYLYTGASDYEMDNKYLKYINNVKIIQWIGHNITMKHKKVAKIPIGLPTKVGENAELLEKLRQRRIKFENKEDTMLVTHMEQTCEKRKKIQYYFQKKNWAEVAPKCDYESYMSIINKHKFVCCPRGNGIDTYRFWETIYMGCVPIVESSPLDDLYSKVNCIIVDSFLNLKKEQLDNFIYNNDLMGEESLLLESYDSNISIISSSNSY